MWEIFVLTRQICVCLFLHWTSDHSVHADSSAAEHSARHRRSVAASKRAQAEERSAVVAAVCHVVVVSVVAIQRWRVAPKSDQRGRQHGTEIHTVRVVGTASRRLGDNAVTDSDRDSRVFARLSRLYRVRSAARPGQAVDRRAAAAPRIHHGPTVSSAPSSTARPER